MIVGELLPTHMTVIVLCFSGISTMLYPRLYASPSGMDN